MKPEMLLKSAVIQMVLSPQLSKMQMVKLSVSKMVPSMQLITQSPSVDLLVKPPLMQLVMLPLLILLLVILSMFHRSPQLLQQVVEVEALHLPVTIQQVVEVVVLHPPQQVPKLVVLHLQATILTTPVAPTLIKHQLQQVHHTMLQHLLHIKHLPVHLTTLQLQLTLVQVWVTCTLVLQPITNLEPDTSRVIHISKSVNLDREQSATISKQMHTTTFHSLMTRVLV